MEFLKEILGEDLYTKFEEKIKEYNESDSNKEKQVKICDLNAGEYVAKSDYDSLGETLKSKEAELETANNLIADLKNSSNGNEDFQTKITGYETDIANLQEQLEETRINSAVEVALLSAKASDVGYLMFKLTEKGEKLELDENGNIKGWKDKLTGLKTQFPNMFESGNNEGYRVLGDNRLPGSDDLKVSATREEFLKMGYNERLKLKQENEELYKSLVKN